MDTDDTKTIVESNNPRQANSTESKESNMKKILSQYLFIFFLLVTVLFFFSMKIELAIKKHTAQQYKEVRFLCSGLNLCLAW